MFLVGNRSVNTILINECVNGCSLLEDNSRCLLEVSTMTHGAHTKMRTRRLHEVGVQADMPMAAAPGSALSSRKGQNTGAQSHIQECAPNLQGSDTWDAGCLRTRMNTRCSKCTQHTMLGPLQSPTATHNARAARHHPQHHTKHWIQSALTQ